MRSECQQTAGYSSDDPSCVASVEVYPHNAHFFLDIARCFIDAPRWGAPLQSPVSTNMPPPVGWMIFSLLQLWVL